MSHEQFPTDAQYLEDALWLADAAGCTLLEALESLYEISSGVAEAMDLQPDDDVQIEFVTWTSDDPKDDLQ